MNAKPLLLMFLLAAVPTTQAGQAQSKVEATAPPKPEITLNINPVRVEYDQVISQRRETPELQIGNGNYAVSGVLVEGLRRKRSSQDRSLGQKILGLPVVRLFVPQPMPSPPGHGKYFRWGESERPWTAIAEGGAPGIHDNAVTHEAVASLISIHR